MAFEGSRHMLPIHWLQSNDKKMHNNKKIQNNMLNRLTAFHSIVLFHSSLRKRSGS